MIDEDGERRFRFGRKSLLELHHLPIPRWESREIEVEAVNQLAGGRPRGRGELGLLPLSFDQEINETAVFRGEGGVLDQGLERPECPFIVALSRDLRFLPGSGIRGSSTNPFFEIGNDGRSERLLGGHLEVVFPLQGVDEEALFRITRNQGSTGFTARPNAFSRVEEEFPSQFFGGGGMALVARLGENRTDAIFEEDSIR